MAQTSWPATTDVRSVSVAVMALMLSIFMLHWASAVFVPLLLGVMSSYALSPAVERMQRWHIPRALGAAAKIEQAAEEGGSAAPAASKGVTRVQIERAHFNIKDYLWGSTLGLVGLLGQAMVVLFITFFLLASGNRFRRKMVKIAGRAFSKMKITIQVLDDITEQIQRNLTVQLFTSVLVGVATWLESCRSAHAAASSRRRAGSSCAATRL